jgi:hypothetical protein
MKHVDINTYIHIHTPALVDDRTEDYDEDGDEWQDDAYIHTNIHTYKHTPALVDDRTEDYDEDDEEWQDDEAGDQQATAPIRPFQPDSNPINKHMEDAESRREQKGDSDRGKWADGQNKGAANVVSKASERGASAGAGGSAQNRLTEFEDGDGSDDGEGNVCVCMCVCVCVCMHGHICVSQYAQDIGTSYMHTYICIHTYIHTYVGI